MKYGTDDTLNFDDDFIDVNPVDGARALNLNVKLAPCIISGDANNICGSIISTSGLENDAVTMLFHINVVTTGSPGLGIECLHNPIWPEKTDNIAINARVLDGNLQPNLIFALIP